MEDGDIARDQCCIKPTVIKVEKESKPISDINQSNSDESTCSYSYNIDAGKTSTIVEIDLSSDGYSSNKSSSQYQEVIDLSQSEEDNLSFGTKESIISTQSCVNSDHRDISSCYDSDQTKVKVGKNCTVQHQIDAICHKMDSWEAVLYMPCVQNNIYQNKFDIFSMCDEIYKGCDANQNIYLDPRVYRPDGGFKGSGYKALAKFLSQKANEEGYMMHFNGNSSKTKIPVREFRCLHGKKYQGDISK